MRSNGTVRRLCPIQRLLVASVLLAGWLARPAPGAEPWWQFRGPHAGHVQQRDLPLRWGGFFDPPLWQVTIPGKGWSSPIVVGDRIWLTTAEHTALDQARAGERLSELPLGARDLVAHASVRLLAVEVDAQSGSLMRQIELFECPQPPPIHSMNSYASPTPTSDGQRLYCHFGALGTAALELASGEVLWKRQFLVDELTGGAASPVLYGDCLYLACDGADEQYVVAVDKLTGQTRWRADRPVISAVDASWRRAFSTPIVLEGADRCQLISMSAQWLMSYNPLDGKPWWQAKVGEGYSAVPTPVAAEGLVFVCTGFPRPELVAVTTTGSGDVTRDGIRWRYSRQVPEIASPIIVGQEIYLASSQGVISCLDMHTGQAHWQHRVGGKFAASPVLADGRLYFTTTAGETTVVAPGREYVELQQNQLYGESYASLAVFENSFLLRTNPLLFRF